MECFRSSQRPQFSKCFVMYQEYQGKRKMEDRKWVLLRNVGKVADF